MKKQPSTPEDRTAELEEKLRSKIGKGAEEYSPSDWRSLREQFRLPLLYPGHHVAFRDHHEGEGAGRRLVSREVVYVGGSLEEVQKHLSSLPDEQLQGIFIEDVPASERKSRHRRS
jgi:hypothetical protein